MSFAALTVARDFSSLSFAAIEEELFDLQIVFPGNQHLIRLLQAEIARREDALPQRHSPSWLESLPLPF